MSPSANITSTKSTPEASIHSSPKLATTSSDENPVLKLQHELAVLRAICALAEKELEILKTKEAVEEFKAKPKAADKMVPVQPSHARTDKPYRPKASKVAMD